MNTHQCPTCGGSYPARHFVNQRTLTRHKSCRVCRNRAAARAWSHAQRKKAQHLRWLHGDIIKRQNEAARVNAHILKVLFNRAVGPHKARIKQLQEKENKTERTLKAIDARQTIIARYERAYAAQLDMLEQGLRPNNIHDMV